MGYLKIVMFYLHYSFTKYIIHYYTLYIISLLNKIVTFKIKLLLLFVINNMFLFSDVEQSGGLGIFQWDVFGKKNGIIANLG